MKTESRMCGIEFENVVGTNDKERPWLEIRTPRAEDIRGIVTVVRACEPYLTAHMSYIYWMDIRYFCETCAVAELAGELVGWCSIIPVSSKKYFLHQLGVAPGARRRGLAEALLAYQVIKLKGQLASFELDFTVDRQNGMALRLIRSVADRTGMQMQKRPEVVELLEEGCKEELYVMSPRRSKSSGSDLLSPD
jgi:L-2,4-diaminobutyric acid acetyltransferase